MVSRGEAETQVLKQNVEDQLQRLITQLRDLEENKEDLEEEEYNFMKQDTILQMQEFEKQLDKWKSGDISLIDEINRIQIAIRQAVSESFKTPDVIQMFASKQPQQLRSRLEELERDRHLNKINQQDFEAKKLEVLVALSKLEEPLSEEEQEFLVCFSSAGNRVATSGNDQVDKQELLSHAKKNFQNY